MEDQVIFYISCDHNLQILSTKSFVNEILNIFWLQVHNLVSIAILGLSKHMISKAGVNQSLDCKLILVSRNAPGLS